MDVKDNKKQASARQLFVAACGVICVIVATRIGFLNVPAIWIDEAFSIFYAQKGLGWIWGSDWRVEPTPPLYYTLLAGWAQLTGYSEPLLRLFSLLWSALAGVFLLLLGNELGGRRAGIAAALLWAVLPLNIEYGLEIRAYALELAEIAALLWVFARLLRLANERALSEGSFVRYALALVLVGLVTSYTHITGVFAFAAVSASLLLYLALKGNTRAAILWLAFNVLYALGLIPQILASHAVVTGNAVTLAWLPPLSVTFARWVVKSLFLGNAPFGTLVNGLITGLWLSALAMSVFALRRRPAALLVGCLVPVLGFGFVAALSLFEPALLPRTVLWITLPLMALAGTALTQTFTPGRSALALALCVPFMFWISTLNMQIREDWHSDYAGIEKLKSISGGDLLVAIDGEKACIMQYYGVDPSRLRLLSLGPDAVFHRRQMVDIGCNLPPKLEPSDIAAHLRAGQSLWLIATPASDGQRWTDIETLAETVREAGRHDTRIDLTGFGALKLAPLSAP